VQDLLCAVQAWSALTDVVVFHQLRLSAAATVAIRDADHSETSSLPRCHELSAKTRYLSACARGSANWSRWRSAEEDRTSRDRLVEPLCRRRGMTVQVGGTQVLVELLLNIFYPGQRMGRKRRVDEREQAAATGGVEISVASCRHSV